MKTIFRSLELWEYVNVGFVEPENTEQLNAAQRKALKENQEKVADALSKIQSGVSDSIFPRIMRASTTKKACEILQQEFHGSDKVQVIKLQNLRREFENIKIKENESMNKFSSRFIELVNQMKSCGDDISDKKQVEKILISLPDKFIPIVSVIEETRSIYSFSIQSLMVKNVSESSIESAF